MKHDYIRSVFICCIKSIFVQQLNFAPEEMVTDIPIFTDRLGHMRHRGRVEDIRPRGAPGRHDLRRLVVPGGQQDNLGQERGHHALVARECPQQGGEKLRFSQL